jgi:hypothetical protein
MARTASKAATAFWKVAAIAVYVHLVFGILCVAAIVFLLDEADAPRIRGFGPIETVLIFAVFRGWIISGSLLATDAVAIYIIERGRAHPAVGRIARASLVSAGLIAVAHVIAVTVACRIGTFRSPAVTFVIGAPELVWKTAALNAAVIFPAVLTWIGVTLFPEVRGNTCRKCGYDLEGLAGSENAPCPECGRPVP